MAVLTPIRFIAKEKSNFYQTLNARVEAYFKARNLPKQGNLSVYLKGIALLSLYLLPFFLMLFYTFSFAWAMVLWALMGWGMAGVGMSIMHDANHGAFSKFKWVNEWVGYSLLLLGGSVFNWKLQHNMLHHTFTNISHYDEDIADKPGLRLSPNTELKRSHRFQWLHALVIYSLVTLYWVTAKDFLQFARYSKMGINKNTASENRIFLLKLIGIKIAYFAVFLGLPLLAGVPVLQVIAGFILMHLVGGTILTVIFQLAHSVEETTFPMPNEAGNLEQEWAVHQMETTVNFSRKNRILSWYVGGLNFQVEHHLFPKICHIHYPKISKIVKETAKEFDVPYLEHRSFWHALRSHFATLKRFGKLPKMEEMMG